MVSTESSRISVAMATFNGLPYLREQLESIQAQSHSPQEIVVCDDASNDGTWDYLLTASAADSRIRVHRNPQRLGSTKNFERAIELCRGDIIFLSDQDDIWYPRKIEIMSAAMLRRDAVLLMSNGRLIKENGRDLGATLWQAHRIDRQVTDLLQSPSAYELLARRSIVTGAASCFKTCLKHTMMPIPVEAWHDQWIALTASITAPGQIVLLDEILYSYRQHSRNQIGASFYRTFSMRMGINLFRKVWREITSHHDLARDAAFARHAACWLSAYIQHHPQKLGALRDVLEVLERRVHHFQARHAFIEHRSSLHIAFSGSRLKAYNQFSRGWSTVVRDFLSWLLFKPGAGNGSETISG